MKMKLYLLVLLACLWLSPGYSREVNCPLECHCYYKSTFNWYVDCSRLNLTYLHVDEMPLKGVELNAAQNHLRSHLEFPKHLQLRILRLEKNDFEQLNRDDFKTLNLLQEIDLSDNRISHIDPETFWDNRGLISLRLHGNPLTFLDGPFLSQQRSLLYLDLSNCNIQSLPENFFSGLPSIIELNLNHNPLHLSNRELLSPLNALQVLYMESCDLDTIPAGFFLHQKHLEKLHLTGNQFHRDDIPWQILMEELPSLQALILKNSSISTLPNEMFTNNDNLTHLDISYNDLGDFNLSSVLPNHLIFLDLSECHLKGHLTEDIFDNSPDIEILIMPGNWLTANDLDGLLSRMPKLHHLSLSRCNLSRLPDLPSSLENLDISYNPLHPNSLTSLSQLHHLQRLDLRGCGMSNIPQELLLLIDTLQELQTSGNQWPCECNNFLLSKLDDLIECIHGNDIQRWSNFIKNRNIDCRPKNERLIQENHNILRMFQNFELNDTPPSWLVAVASFALFIFLSTLMIGGLVILVKSARRAATINRKQMETVTVTEEEARHEEELIKYLRAHRAFDAPKI